MEQVIIDVRERDEFEAEHIPGSICVPLSRFAHVAPGVLQTLVGKKVLLMCRSGVRAGMARRNIPRLGFGGQIKAEVYAGGILEWARLGKPVVRGTVKRRPLLAGLPALLPWNRGPADSAEAD